MSEHEKNIGFLWPCDGLNDSEYWKFLPKDVKPLLVGNQVSICQHFLRKRISP